MLVFIDESGDPGFKILKGSSPRFVVSLVAFQKVEQSLLAIDAINAVATKHKIPGEFKFVSTRPVVRDDFFASLNAVDYCVRAIVIDKSKIYSRHLRTEKEAFYNYFMKNMLRFDGGLLKDAKIVIDGCGDKSFRNELSSYIKRHANNGSIKNIRFSNSKNDRLIQMADMVTGAIARSYRTDRQDADRWRNQISAKIDDVWNFG